MATETAELQAGAKLDALVAQQVMGWTEGDYRVPHDRDEESDMHQTRWFDGGKATKWMVSHRYAYRGPHMFCPSTDIAAAWQVVAELQRRQWEVSIDWSTEYNWCCQVVNGVPFGGVEETNADTAPLAICRAALAAVHAAA